MHAITIIKKEAMNFKENREGYMAEFGGRKAKRGRVIIL